MKMLAKVGEGRMSTAAARRCGSYTTSPPNGKPAAVRSLYDGYAGRGVLLAEPIPVVE
jgi:hypothetical protein